MIFMSPRAEIMLFIVHLGINVSSSVHNCGCVVFLSFCLSFFFPIPGYNLSGIASHIATQIIEVCDASSTARAKIAMH